MTKPVSIFADVSQGALFFEGTRIPPAPLGGIVLAVENPSRPGKLGLLEVTSLVGME